MSMQTALTRTLGESNEHSLLAARPLLEPLEPRLLLSGGEAAVAPAGAVPLELLEASLAGSLVGVDFDDSTPYTDTPTNWTLHSTSGPATLTNLIDEGGYATPFDLVISSNDYIGEPGPGYPLEPETLPQHGQSLAGVDGYLAWSEYAQTMVFEWQDLEPLGGYAIYVFASTIHLGSYSANDVLIIGADAPVAFIQPLSMDRLTVNREPGDEDRKLTSYAEIVRADASGRIRIEVSTPPDMNSSAVAGLALQPAPFRPMGKLPDADCVASSWADIDADGHLDVLVVRSTGPASPYEATLHHNNGDGTFSLIGALDLMDDRLMAPDAKSFAWGDYNNDGHTDLALASIMAKGDGGSWIRSKTGLFTNDGTGHFTYDRWLAGGGDSADFGDYDNDGDLDLLTTGRQDIAPGFEPVSIVWENNGTGWFWDVAWLPGLYSSDAAWGDYDGDGDLDIIQSGRSEVADPPESATETTEVFQNDGGVFTSVASLPGLACGSVAWGDYDNDGRLDALLTGADWELEFGNWEPSAACLVFHNDGGGLFSQAASLTGVYGGASWGDCDDDGDADILANGTATPGRVGPEQSTDVYRNNGDGTFAHVSTPGLRDVGDGTSTWGDFNGDGYLDVLLSGGDCDVHLNLLAPASGTDGGAPPTPQGARAVILDSWIEFSWDSAPGGEVTYNLRVGTTPGGNEVVSGMALADGTRLVAQMGNVQLNTSWALKKGLVPGQRYYWSVQAVGSNYVGSPWAPEMEIVYYPSAVEPGWRVVDAVGLNGPRSARLSPIDGLLYFGQSDSHLYRMEADRTLTELGWFSDYGLAIDPDDGDAFVTNTLEVRRLGFGQMGGPWPWVTDFANGDNRPSGLAIAPNGYVGSTVSPGEALVVCRGLESAGWPQEVWLFSPDAPEGEILLCADEGTLLDPVDVAIGEANIYVADTGGAADGAIYRIEPGGALTPIGTGEPIGEPSGIAVDRVTGDLLVVDGAAGRVVRVDPGTGAVNDVFVGLSTTPGLCGIEVTPDARQIILTDYGADKIYVFEAVDLVVDTLEDQDDDYQELSLREALYLASVYPGDDVITFDPALAGGAIELAHGCLAVTSNVEILGPEDAPITIDGGGSSRVVSVYSATDALIRNVVVTGGSTTGPGGGIRNDGALTLTDVTVTRNHAGDGGGIWSGGTLRLNRTTIDRNTAMRGGGLAIDAGAANEAYNVTISRNTALEVGGGLYMAGGFVRVINATVTTNVADDGGGICAAPNTVRLHNTIVAGNVAGSSGPSGDDLSAVVWSGSSHNVIGLGDGGNLVNGVDHNQVGGLGNPRLDPLLGPLLDNSGPTETHLPLTGSPAIDQGSAQWAELAGLTVDQRGLPREADGGIKLEVDVGAVEVHAGIRGRKWNDLDEDAFWDAGEPPLGNWQVYLDLNGNNQLDDDPYEPRTVTDDNGEYRFTGLTPGDYLVAEVVPTGWRQTFPGPPLIGVDFGVLGEGSPNNWTLYRGGAGATLHDLTNEAGAATPADLTIASSGSSISATSAAIDPTTLPSHAQSLAGLSGYIYEGGSPTWTLSWRGLLSFLPYEVFVFGLRAFGGANHVAIVGSGTTSFDQTLAPDDLVVNDETGDDSRALTSFGTTLRPNAAGVITVTVTPGSGQVVCALGGVAIRAASGRGARHVRIGAGEVAGGVDFGNKQTATPSVSIDDVTMAEGHSGASTFNFPVRLSHPSGQTVTVDYATSDGTAQAPEDYMAASGTVTFSPGETEKMIPVAVIGNREHEPDETFTVNLSNPAEATISDGQGLGTIENDDEGIPPTVMDVLVAGTGWDQGFLDFLEAEGLGEGGYSIPVGSAAQLDELPWLNVDQIKIVLSEDVRVSQSYLAVYGVDTPAYAASGFVYDSSTSTATWTFPGAFGADKLLLVLSDGVADIAGNRLDGEWTDNASTWPSGDGAAGGDFRFRLNVLAGDVDQSGEVRSSDTIKVRRKSNTVPGDADYSVFYDVDGSGEMRSSDTIKVRRLSNTELPGGEPVVPPAAARTGEAAEYEYENEDEHDRRQAYRHGEAGLIAAAMRAARRRGGDRKVRSPLRADALSLAEIVPLVI